MNVLNQMAEYQALKQIREVWAEADAKCAVCSRPRRDHFYAPISGVRVCP